MSHRWWVGLERVPVGIDDPEQGRTLRWRLVETPWFAIRVHRINNPDGGRSIYHTHPWPHLTVVLRGAYHEDVEHRDHNGRLRRFQVDRIRRIGSVHWMRATDAHRVTLLRRVPTWTLVLLGRRRPEPSWGYWRQDYFTPWNEHDEFTPWEDHASAARFTAALRRLR